MSAEKILFSKSHEWCLVGEDNIATVGITEHAQSQLGDIVFVELPEVGQMVAIGDDAGVLESVKTAADLYAPVSGEIVEVNSALSSEPGLINTDALHGGWIYRCKADEVSSELMTEAEYQQFVAAE